MHSTNKSTFECKRIGIQTKRCYIDLPFLEIDEIDDDTITLMETSEIANP